MRSIFFCPRAVTPPAGEAVVPSLLQAEGGGKSRQRTPLLETHTTPSSAALAGTQGLAPFGFGGFVGSGSSTSSHNSSLTERLIPPQTSA
jgi:hypothetical protein